MADRSVVVRLRAEISDYKRAMAEATKATDTLPESAKRAETALGRMVQSAENNRKAWDTAGVALSAFGTATLAGLTLSARAAMNWETAWTGVAKTVDGSTAQLDALEGQLRSMATTLPATHQEIAAVAEAAGQLGIATPSIAAFTKVMIDLGETTNLSADEAATSIAQLMNVMQTAPDDVDNLGAAIVDLGNNGASTERDIVQMAQRIAGAGQIVGLSEGEVLGLANALASVGIEVEAGGTAISKVMTDIAKAVATGSADLTKFAQVAGMSAEDFSQAFQSDPASAIASFVEGLGRLDAAGGDVFTTLDELGQSDVRVSRALLTMANSGDLLRESLELGNTAFEENTALLIEAAKRYDTTAAQVDMARGSLNDAAITIGESLLPAIQQMAGFVGDAADAFAALPAPLVGAISGVAGITGAATLAAGAFLLTFPGVIDTVKSFRDLREISPGAASALGKVGKAAGGLLVFTAVATAVDGFVSATSTVDGIEGTTRSLLGMADAVTALDATFTAMGGTGPFEGQLTGTLAAMDRLISPSFLERVNDFAGEVLSLSANDGSWVRTDIVAQFDAIGQSLAAMVQSGNAERAEVAFDALAAAWVEQGGELEDLQALMPSYQEALDGVVNAQTLAADATGQATGAVQENAQAVEAAATAQAQWSQMVADSLASFVDVQGAYQAVIDANRAWAEETAAATATSEDSWEDYYDGVSVSVGDYIAQLQAQVDAQNAWETNMVTIASRAREGMTGNMAAAAQEMIDELLTLGPEGAAQVQLLADMSDEEFAQVVGLYSQRGAEAKDNFNDQMALLTQPVVNVTADTYGAQQTVDRFIRQNNGRTLYLNAQGNVVGFRTARGAIAGFEGGGYTGDIGTHHVAGVVHGKEFVVNARATAQNRPLLEAINRGVPGYVAGGFVEPRYMTAAAAVAPAPVTAAPGGGLSVTVTADAGLAARFAYEVATETTTRLKDAAAAHGILSIASGV